MCQGKMRSVHRSRERVIVSVIELVTLGSHSGMPHYDIGIIVESQMYFASSVRALINCKFSIVIECVTSSIGTSLLALF